TDANDEDSLKRTLPYEIIVVAVYPTGDGDRVTVAPGPTRTSLPPDSDRTANPPAPDLMPAGHIALRQDLTLYRLEKTLEKLQQTVDLLNQFQREQTKKLEKSEPKTSTIEDTGK